MQMKRFALETCFSGCFQVFYTAWYSFLLEHKDELYLVVVEEHFSEKSRVAL